jgi:hypothetical protein
MKKDCDNGTRLNASALLTDLGVFIVGSTQASSDSRV